MNESVTDPRIHLAMDNSFASKRWTTPGEWAPIIRDLGISCVEASADAEADPFYCGEGYLSDWMDEVQEAWRAHGVRVVNFFTGYTTYRTLGLAHSDARVRSRVIEGWLQVMARIAARVGAGLGFYLHAFSEAVLQDRARYEVTKEALYDTLAQVARFAFEAGPIPIIVEQMYSPHQIPWTIRGCFEYLAEVSRRAGHPAYLAIDTGHQTGQSRFLRASKESIERSIREGTGLPYLGPESAYSLLERSRGLPESETASRIQEEMELHPYFFSEASDGNLYAWLEQLGCYSPIVHLQQSNGKSSGHLPFTGSFNAEGIVHPARVLKAIAQSYACQERPNMPSRCTDIYLTFEIFSRPADRPRDLLPVLRESVQYWRRWVPEDGTRLSSLLSRCPPEGGER